MEREQARDYLLERMLNMDHWENELFENVCQKIAGKKREFQRYVEDLFRPFESGSQRNTFEWGCVKSIYNVIKNDANRIWSLRICCVYVLDLFCRFDCEDHPLIMKIIYMYHQVLNEYENGISFLALCPHCMRVNNPKHYFFEELKGSRSILHEVDRIAGIKYRFTNSEIYSKLSMGALYEGDYVFLKFLVKYGLSFFPEDEMEEAEVEFKRLKYSYVRLKRLEDYDGGIGDRNLNVFLIQELFTDVEDPNIRRLILILRCVNICLRRRLNDEYYPDYVKCLKLYVLTLSEAAISVKDVDDLLNLLFDDDPTFIAQICSDFQEIFKGSPSLPSPRSLQHLCRCTVRDSIQDSLLPSMLSDLQIPPKIKDYLLILSE